MFRQIQQEQQFDNSLARCSFQLSWRTSVGTTHLLFRQWSKLCKTRFHFSLSARSWLLEKERGSKGWNGNFLKEENYLMIFYLFIRYFFSHTRKWRLICQRSHSYSLSTFVNETYKPIDFNWAQVIRRVADYLDKSLTIDEVFIDDHLNEKRLDWRDRMKNYETKILHFHFLPDRDSVWASFLQEHEE